MRPSFESVVSARLRTVLADLGEGAAIPASSAFQDALEFWVPALLGWRYESIDAFRFASARKVTDLSAEFLGLCLLISDQTWTPLHLRVTLARSADSFDSVQCSLGEPGTGAKGLLRVPFTSKKGRLPARVASIQGWRNPVGRRHYPRYPRVACGPQPIVSGRGPSNPPTA